MDKLRQVFSKFASSIPKGNPQLPSGGGTAAGVLLTLGALGYGGYHSMVTIQPGHTGIIYNRLSGLEEKSVLTEGLNFVIPWFQRAIVYDIRTRPQPIDTQSGSKGALSQFVVLRSFSYSTIKMFSFRLANGTNLSSCSFPPRC